MKIRIRESRERLAKQDIARVEAALGFPLPVQYRNFLLAHNGGYPEPDAFPIQDNPSDDHGLVHYFLCIKQGDIYNLMDYVHRFRGRVPQDLLPIAVDPGGNLICLSVGAGSPGKVYFWDHEEEAPEGEAPGYNNVYAVAESFREFLSSLAELTG